ncbi:CBS domain-containing protein [Algivirga pacifica]|uniref:Glutamate-cysteine ligase family protein n=1 Tax=Algivirga pacifica TaxID=1162670 RepID=A0ABP9DIF1_9BACT
MGDLHINSIDLKQHRSSFTRHLLEDLQALERMLSEGLIEEGVRRIGAEQEFCLTKSDFRPSLKAPEILKAIDDPHFTTELAKFNLEINLDPLPLEGDCFSRMEEQLYLYLQHARNIAQQHDNKIILTGILPSITKKELVMDYMTPNPRYWALNKVMSDRKGGHFDLHIMGVDELSVQHDSVLFEACNTSFQMHLQISPSDFVQSYNWAQAITAPLMGICTNSPLLLGKELWHETRIALFRQSIDTRTSSMAVKNQHARVTFGNDWVRGNAASLFQEDISNYPIILGKEISEDTLDILNKGGTPKLKALSLHNGTIYRWNRPCYGVNEGKTHLRIENRYIPSGPTVLDEMANFAFWVGLMVGRPKLYDNIAERMDFRDVKANFTKTARYGIDTTILWMDKAINCRELIEKELLPIAYQGLESMGVAPEDIQRLLQVVEGRTSLHTASQWMVKSYRHLGDTLPTDAALITLTKSIHDNQQTGLPIHQWPLPLAETMEEYQPKRVSHLMSTELLTVNEYDLLDMAMEIMRWKNIRHLPVENHKGELVGLLSSRHIEKVLTTKNTQDAAWNICDIMEKDPITISPDTLLPEARKVMQQNGFSCLPVVKDGQLVGIITEKDF